ncbi:hypothetical protein Nepgr_008031 [Nepenthes gracilis]|uniref:Uncharacterized protein n=1 Tax=Nepenthes gracilis TaxID=150966 RepID=A0AAD3S8B6_NEPGR|nr:hypothetical protein Nepgr_008031 [Nepenthes gracilis]
MPIDAKANCNRYLSPSLRANSKHPPADLTSARARSSSSNSTSLTPRHAAALAESQPGPIIKGKLLHQLP